ncbi:hypothetical protein HMPREF1624_05914 [Sporothrix schenckii ATCC 58251]|uniref:Glycosyltransferase 2 n=1 Tax=Sporothrix schenckii (strain ATCC 58251 / de Perez 2211183) TaxID=1391915 RepID=U7PQ28_SPOS1|nr:hypothetical protein HMPREF1624_05914 [Sporothrix schenckii ATCC 58251]
MATVQDRVRGTVQSLFLSDVEMGKKDDDHLRPRTGSSSSGHGASSVLHSVRVHPRKLLKRLAIGVLALLAVYLFVKNLPSDLPVRDHRRPVYQDATQPRGHDRQKSPPPPRPPPPPPEHPKAQAPPFNDRLGNLKAPEVPPSAPVAPDAAPPQPRASAVSPAVGYYNGQLRFLELAGSLRSISSTHGSFRVNKNVLFAAGSLNSIATLLPLACQMGTELRSYVHFMVMSKSEISLAALQQIHGIDASCNIFFHDARPEYASISTDERMENGVDVAMSHVQLYMHPQAIIIDGTNAEETFFKAGMRTHAKSSHTTLIELPKRAPQRLAWLTKLDSASLSSWNKISIDILIHAYPGASGSLIRLLKSLSGADFGGGSVPHVTIELPQKIDPPTVEFLESFRWPPAGFADASDTKQLSLRHRIPKHGVSEEESSVRFLESFWPTHPQDSHVLVLSPQTELAPDFFHYIKYALLEYRYSNPALLQEWDKRLFGISLDLPRTALDGSTPFVPPAPLKKGDTTEAAAASAAGTSADTSADSSFLWQAPNSNAVLFLGERWADLHRFIAQLLATQRMAEPESKSHAEQPVKRVSKTFPAWLEHALQLCQARGFWTLYPSSTTASALATVHDELYKPPEEYEEDVLADAAAAGSNPHWTGSDEVRLGSKTLLEALPHRGGTATGDTTGLAPFSDLPLLAWDGKSVTLDELNDQSVEYATHFRRTTGGCSEGMLAVLLPETLFCNDMDD